MTPKEAAQKILAGELVVFPTETVYGLGALASNERAVAKIFEAKVRPQHNPLILHIADPKQLEELVEEIPEPAKKLIQHFWPGPLTLCFRKSKTVSDLVTAGLPTVCIRCPDHPLAQEFLKLVGKPVAAPSANLSGSPSTTRSEDAKRQLEDKGIFFLDGGQSPLGIESTVIDVTSSPPAILRHGAISKEEMEAVLGESIHDKTQGKEITSPGQMLEHYAPKGHLTVVMGESEKRRRFIKHHPDYKASTIGFVGSFAGLKPAHLFELSDRDQDQRTFAARLYTFLNWCDRIEAKIIFIEFPLQQDPLRSALLDRLGKASSGNIVNID